MGLRGMTEGGKILHQHALLGAHMPTWTPPNPADGMFGAARLTKTLPFSYLHTTNHWARWRWRSPCRWTPGVWSGSPLWSDNRCCSQKWKSKKNEKKERGSPLNRTVCTHKEAGGESEVGHLDQADQNMYTLLLYLTTDQQQYLFTGRKVFNTTQRSLFSVW